MSATFGDRLRLTIFGESHAEAIGGVLEGLPSGMVIDEQMLREHMRRRAPGRSTIMTSRQEADEVRILSGVFEGHTTGTPLSFMIQNQDPHIKDYEPMRFVLRPGHADYTAYAKYGGFQDYRGGGGFSGRLTAVIHAAGGLAEQLLGQKEVTIIAHALSVGDQRDCSFAERQWDIQMSQEQIKGLQQRLRQMPIPTVCEERSEEMAKAIERIRREKDSIGGVAECGIFGLPAGLGGGFFSSVESRLAQLCFSIPAVKGIEFGAGFELAQMKGSEANDVMYLENDRSKASDCLQKKLRSIRHATNHNGGILGGITNAMPLIFRVAVKPTPSIGKTQPTVDLRTMKEMQLMLKGRHDPCILPRVIPVIESGAALVTADLLMGRFGEEVFL